jgi:rod shape-determining protein MreC
LAGSSTDSAPLFAEGHTSTLRLSGYLILAAVMMVADYRGRYLDAVRRAAESLIGPVYWLAAAPSRTYATVRGVVADREVLSADNRRLREQLLLAEARLARLAAVQDQNGELRELLDARTKLGLKAQLAELIDVDLDPFRHRILLDVGARDGIRVGQAVIDSRGVMGQVVAVHPERAEMILLTDASHAIPVRVARSGLRTIAYGTGDIDTLRLPHIPFSADIRVGDELLTSGLGGNFPAGLSVGTVRQVTPDDSATFVLAVASPSAGMSRSGEVLVLHDERERLNEPGGDEIDFVGPPEALSAARPTAPAAKPATTPEPSNPPPSERPR